MAIKVQHEGEVTQVFSSQVVASATSAYSNGVDIEEHQYYGVWWYFTPASAASAAGVDLWYEEAPTNTASGYASAGSIIASSNAHSAVASGLAITPYPMKWIRFGLRIGAGCESISADVHFFHQ